MPMISTNLRTGGVPRALKVPAGFEVAECRMLARSSSENLPSGPRFNLFPEREHMDGVRERGYTYPANVRLEGSAGTSAKIFPIVLRSLKDSCNRTLTRALE